MEKIVFKRKIYEKILKWKSESNGESALMIQGARRIQELISPNDIQIGVLIEESLSTNMNDLDVVFTLGNKLFVIECKTGVGGRSLFSQILYKASALKETLFGLSGKSYIFSLSPEVESLKIVAKNMGVTYCDETYFNQHEKIEDLITSMKLYAKN